MDQTDVGTHAGIVTSFWHAAISTGLSHDQVAGFVFHAPIPAAVSLLTAARQRLIGYTTQGSYSPLRSPHIQHDTSSATLRPQRHQITHFLTQGKENIFLGSTAILTTQWFSVCRCQFDFFAPKFFIIPRTVFLILLYFPTLSPVKGSDVMVLWITSKYWAIRNCEQYMVWDWCCSLLFVWLWHRAKIMPFSISKQCLSVSFNSENKIQSEQRQTVVKVCDLARASWRSHNKKHMLEFVNRTVSTEVNERQSKY